jgi:hypothetical protein
MKCSSVKLRCKHFLSNNDPQHLKSVPMNLHIHLRTPIISIVRIEGITFSYSSISSEKAFYNFVVADVETFLHNVSQLREHFFFHHRSAACGTDKIVGLPQYRTKHVDGSVPY